MGRGEAEANGAVAQPVPRYLALVSDGDGTLTRGKHLALSTIVALERLRAAGRKVILATGETEKDLADFPHLGLFDLVVAENGAVLYRPKTRRTTRLAEPPPAGFIRELRRHDVKPLSTGRVIVSTCRPGDRIVVKVIRDMGLDWRVIFNRKQVMALPAGVDKATGLAVALEEMGLSPARAVGVGDAENDIALLRYCGCGVAVASAVPGLQEHAAWVTEGGAGRGVVELIRRLLAGDLPAVRAKKKVVRD